MNADREALLSLAALVGDMRALQRRWGAQRSWMGGEEVTDLMAQERRVDGLVARILNEKPEQS